MKLIVGLGNPERRYHATRHNIGFRVVESLANRHGLVFDMQKFQGLFGRGRIQGVDVGLLEPATYMNLSGQSVAEALRFLPVDDISKDLMIVSDDVDLPFGRLRLRSGGGPGGHKGLSDIISRLGGDQFPRLRFGVDRPPPPLNTADYVLQRFTNQEESEITQYIDGATAALEQFLEGDMEKAMNTVNQRKESKRD